MSILQRQVIKEMTIEELRQSDKMFLTPGEISETFGSNPQTIRVQAQQNPQSLGFPVSVIGSRVRIPRIPYLKFLGY